MNIAWSLGACFTIAGIAVWALMTTSPGDGSKPVTCSGCGQVIHKEGDVWISGTVVGSDNGWCAGSFRPARHRPKV